MVATLFFFSSVMDYLMMPESKGRITFPTLLYLEKTEYSEVFHRMHGSLLLCILDRDCLKCVN